MGRALESVPVSALREEFNSIFHYFVAGSGGMIIFGGGLSARLQFYKIFRSSPCFIIS